MAAAQGQGQLGGVTPAIGVGMGRARQAADASGGRRRRKLLDQRLALEAELAARGVEPGHAVQIAERVGGEAEFAGFRRDGQPRLDNALILALLGVQQHPMLAEPHRRGVAIAGEVPYDENGHRAHGPRAQ